MILSDIRVFGVTDAPHTVTVNGQSASFQYNSDTKVLPSLFQAISSQLRTLVTPLSLFGWPVNKKTARVEDIASLAFLYWVGIALHPRPFVLDIAIFHYHHHHLIR